MEVGAGNDRERVVDWTKLPLSFLPFPFLLVALGRVLVLVLLSVAAAVRVGR